MEHEPNWSFELYDENGMLRSDNTLSQKRKEDSKSDGNGLSENDMQNLERKHIILNKGMPGYEVWDEMDEIEDELVEKLIAYCIKEQSVYCDDRLGTEG
jgi:hypothetical protein